MSIGLVNKKKKTRVGVFLFLKHSKNLGDKLVDKKNTYKIKFKGGYNQATDKLDLNISIDKKLRNIIKSVCINESVEYILSIGRHVNKSGKSKEQSMKFKRYLVKGPIISAMYGNYTQILFIKDFVDTGKLKLSFNEFEIRDRVIKEMKENIQSLLRAIEKINVNQSVPMEIIA